MLVDSTLLLWRLLAVRARIATCFGVRTPYGGFVRYILGAVAGRWISGILAGSWFLEYD